MDGGSSKTAGVQFLDSIESLTTLSSEGTVDSLQVRGAGVGGGGGGRRRSRSCCLSSEYTLEHFVTPLFV